MATDTALEDLKRTVVVLAEAVLRKDWDKATEIALTVQKRWSEKDERKGDGE